MTVAILAHLVVWRSSQQLLRANAKKEPMRSTSSCRDLQEGTMQGRREWYVVRVDPRNVA